MSAGPIEKLTLAEDLLWCKRIWQAASQVFGTDSAPLYRALRDAKGNEFFLGIREVAFVHYRARRDGVNVVYEIAVDPAAKRRGLATRLLLHIGPPILLKTDADHEESNALYRARGFKFMGTKQGQKKLLNEYLWEAALS